MDYTEFSRTEQLNVLKAHLLQAEADHFTATIQVKKFAEAVVAEPEGAPHDALQTEYERWQGIERQNAVGIETMTALIAEFTNTDQHTITPAPPDVDTE